MGWGRAPRRSLAEQEEQLESVTLEDETVSHQLSIAEKNAMIAQLRKQYGSDWRHILGLNGRLSISDLKGALANMNRGMRTQSSSVTVVGQKDPRLSPLPPSSMRM